MEIELADSEYDVLERAFARWGDWAQARAAMEELAETITAISHYDRSRAEIQEVIDEFADAFVCVMQVIHSEIRPHVENREAKKDLVEMAINQAFVKLAMKLDRDDQNYVEGR